MRLDLNQSLEGFRADGFIVGDASQTLVDVGEKNKVPPQPIYLAMKSKAKASKSQAGPSNKPMMLPNSPPPGTGNMTLVMSVPDST